MLPKSVLRRPAEVIPIQELTLNSKEFPEPAPMSKTPNEKKGDFSPWTSLSSENDQYSSWTYSSNSVSEQQLSPQSDKVKSKN